MPRIEEVSGPPRHQWSLPGKGQRMAIGEETEGGQEPGSFTPVMAVTEAEQYVEGLKEYAIEDVGSSRWLQQHELMEKLNLQAHQSARSHTDEFVLEAFITFDKLPLLIRDLILVDVWREQVLPLVLEPLAERRATMRAYFVLYHEATAINLLEVLLYHAHGCEAAGDALLELVDYCAKKMAYLNSGRASATINKDAQGANTNIKEVADKLSKVTPKQELQSQADELQFQVSVTAVAVLRFLCEHIESLPLAVFNRLLSTHDILLGLIPLIENPPWTRRRQDGKWQKLVDFKWQMVEPVDLLKLTKYEGQAWLALFHLICSGEVRKRYHFNSFRKNALLRVRKYLNDMMLDQLPVLADVQRFMDELAVAQVPEPTSLPPTLLLEQVATVRAEIMEGREWNKVAKDQLKDHFSSGDGKDEDLRRLASIYTSDWVDEIAGDTKCARCGKEATKRCGRCRIEWYCSRECQVQAWKAHKAVCDLVTANKMPSS